MVTRLVAGFLCLLLGAGMFFADRVLFNTVDWSRPWPVTVFRIFVVASQSCTVLFLVIIGLRTGGRAAKVRIVLPILLVLCGALLSVLGWLKIDSLLKDLGAGL